MPLRSADRPVCRPVARGRALFPCATRILRRRAQHRGAGLGQRRDQDTFPKESARYIYTAVSLKNLKWNIKDQDIYIRLRCYHSNGDLFGHPGIDYPIPSDRETAEPWNGWGGPKQATGSRTATGSNYGWITG